MKTNLDNFPKEKEENFEKRVFCNNVESGMKKEKCIKYLKGIMKKATRKLSHSEELSLDILSIVQQILLNGDVDKMSDKIGEEEIYNLVKKYSKKRFKL